MLKVFADRGGTFTDLVAVTEDQEMIDRLSLSPERFQITSLADQSWIVIYKLLSEQPEQYQDQGKRTRILTIAAKRIEKA